jgi:hypothetical protein
MYTGWIFPEAGISNAFPQRDVLLFTTRSVEIRMPGEEKQGHAFHETDGVAK